MVIADKKDIEMTVKGKGEKKKKEEKGMGLGKLALLGGGAYLLSKYLKKRRK